VGEVWGISTDSSGTTFVCNNRILRWNGERFIVWEMPSESKLAPIRSQGKFFVHHKESGLHEILPDGPRLRVDRKFLPESLVLFAERHESRWLLGSSDGFFLLENGIRTNFAPDVSEFLKLGRLSCATRLPDGRIAVGTLSRGLAFLHPDGSLDNILDDRHGLPTPHITSVFVSRAQQLWITTGSHILRVDLDPRSGVFDQRSGLPRQTYRRIAKAGESIFVANESAVYRLERGARRFEQIEKLRGRWQNIQGLGDGLLVSGFQGSFYWNGARVTPMYQDKVDVFAAAKVRNNPDDLLMVERNSVVRRFSDGTWDVVVRGLPEVSTSIAEDVDGRLWIGTSARGLYMAPPHSDGAVVAQSASGSFGVPELTGRAHVRTNAAGTVLVVANVGAWQKAAGAATFVPVINFPERGVAAVSDMAADGSVWVAHENTDTLAPCVGRIARDGTTARWEPHAVAALLDAGAPRSILAETGERGETVLWIGGTHALLRHVIEGELSAEMPQPPLLRAFAREAAEGTRAPIVSALPYSTPVLEFEFAAPEFSRRSLLRIETRIDGVDDEWTVLPPGTRRELTAIRDGAYIVKARVLAETGALSPETTFSFQVLPPWWRTAPGVAIYVLAGVALCFGGYRLRVQTLRRRNGTLEARIRERTKELEAANAAKTQFVANMSHDIRNPLNGIVGLALALEDTRLDLRQRELVSTLRECTTYLSSLVDDVLDFASIEAGRVELRPRNFGPQELLRSIIETMKAEATASGAVLSVSAGADVPPSLHGDAGRIQQILVNFVSNALKYAGGDISLSVKTSPHDPGEIEFSVTDRGPGISAEEQATLFTKFARLRQQRGGEDIPGTGLGLAACRLLADIMGGAVGVQSRPGEGARFFLRLPLTTVADLAITPPAPMLNTAVLLVEDTDYNAWAAQAVLAKLGLSCERARTGEEALRLFGSKPFHVVLLDRNLPDMDGTEVARRMRKMEAGNSQAVLLAVTAYCTAEDRTRCLQSGMDTFVGKPLTPEKLRKALLDAGTRLLASASVHVPVDMPAPELDVGLLGYLSDGSVKGLEQQVRRFVDELLETESELGDACTRGDFEAIGKIAHRVLGHARMVGCGSLGQAATELEALATLEDETACRAGYQQLHAEILNLTEAMRRARSAAPSK
jgi:signal transduction histidine kinase/CheY-like chemotaxis protein/HPt (histidine-containing phosphotransfer) domain-containing protein